MAKNDDGEFELVLGNRQLLSGFFIVVVLFGLFFTMGYIVGRHSSPASVSTASAVSQEPTSTPANPSAGPAPGQAEVVVEQPKPSAPESPEPATGTRPATAPPVTPQPTVTRRTETAPSSFEVSEPAPGVYLQVAAPKRSAAGGVIDSLKNKSITAVLAPGPNEETVRVLVGPLDSAALGKMRMDLESAGFKPFVKKY
jgi:cell division septation protein DedD